MSAVHPPTSSAAALSTPPSAENRGGYCVACAADIARVPSDGLCPFCAGTLAAPRTQLEKANERAAAAAAAALLPLTEEGRETMGIGVVGLLIGAALVVGGVFADGRLHLAALGACVWGINRMVKANDMRG
jgi:hypothetical protein